MISNPKIMKAFLFIVSVMFFFATFSEVGYGANFNEQEIVSYFDEANPIWPEGRQLEKNITIGFRGEFYLENTSQATLRITGSSLYRVFLNGKFVGHGPARAAHDYYRVDMWELEGYLNKGKNILAIEVAGYNVNSYYLLDQPSFLQAEVVSGKDVLLATGSKSMDFEAFLVNERMQKVPRYSFQRPFVECYRLSPGVFDWRSGDANFSKLSCEIVGDKKLLPRHVKYPDFTILFPVSVYSEGKIQMGQKPEKYWSDRAVKNIGEQLKGFTESELSINPARDLQEMKLVSHSVLDQHYSAESVEKLSSNDFMIFDFGLNTTGFVGARIVCKKAGHLYLTFDEILSEGDVDFKRMSCINAITYDLEPGEYEIESFEPYTLKYLKMIMVDGESEISDVYLRTLANSDISRANFSSSDENLNLIYKAGVETFKQNALDIFMDCPSRERAGWLCDSYFAARVASDLSGNTLIEKNVFENYLLPDQFEFLPKGMLPMCYPADHNDGVFIPNWAMWFVIQLEEYHGRSNDKTMVDALRPKVMDLLSYFEQFTNDDGLLENLDSWIFVEWSEANKFVQDVNYPTNMLYSAALQAVANMYGMPELSKKATRIKEKIIEQSYNGNFFVDNAVRDKSGRLKPTENVSEVCQYYAFYFNVATPETHGKLWNNLVDNFGPQRKKDNKFPDVHFANSFPGNYLRLELLSKNQKAEQLLDESVEFFSYMAERTGTLWENISPTASCNHGFASHTVHLLYRDVLGIYEIDHATKKITLQFSDLNLSSCNGQIPVEDGVMSLAWEKHGNSMKYRVSVPDQYEIGIRNLSGIELEELK